MVLVLLLPKGDAKHVDKEYNEMMAKLNNERSRILANGSGIYNVNVDIETNDAKILAATKCGEGAQQVSPIILSDQYCQKMCLTQNAFGLMVDDNETYIYNNVQLKEGAYCLLGTRPECNTETTIVLMTLNSVVCKLRYPNVIGGETGNKIIACNTQNLYSPNNILMDRLTGKAMNPYTVIISNGIDEKMEDGSYRFYCSFGKDIMGNQYVEHPIDRFKPFRNFCAKDIYSAHPDVKMIIHDNYDITCDCGDFQTTRVLNSIANDPYSTCWPKLGSEEKTDEDGRSFIRYTLRCLDVNDFLSANGQHPWCLPDTFTTGTSKFLSIDIYTQAADFSDYRSTHIRATHMSKHENLLTSYNSNNLFFYIGDFY